MSDYIFTKEITNQYSLINYLRTNYSGTPTLGSVAGLSYDPTTFGLTIAYSPALSVSDCNVLITAVGAFTNPTEAQVVDMIIASQASQNATSDFAASNLVALTGTFNGLNAAVATILNATFCNITVLNSISTANDVVVADEIRAQTLTASNAFLTNLIVNDVTASNATAATLTVTDGVSALHVAASNIEVISIRGQNAAFSNITIPSISTESASFANLSSLSATFCNVTILNSMTTANSVVANTLTASNITSATSVNASTIVASTSVTAPAVFVPATLRAAAIVASNVQALDLSVPLASIATLTTSNLIINVAASAPIINASVANIGTLGASNVTFATTLRVPGWAGIQTLDANTMAASNLTVSNLTLTGVAALKTVMIETVGASNVNVTDALTAARGFFPTSVAANVAAFSNVSAHVASFASLTGLTATFCNIIVLNSISTANDIVVADEVQALRITGSNVVVSNSLSASAASFSNANVVNTLVANNANLTGASVNVLAASNVTVVNTISAAAGNFTTLAASNVTVANTMFAAAAIVDQYTGSNATIMTATFSNVTIGDIAVSASNNGLLYATHPIVGSLALGLFGSTYTVEKLANTVTSSASVLTWNPRMTLTTPVVPAGTYRVELAFQTRNNSGANNRALRVASYINTSGNIWYDSVNMMAIANGNVSSEYFNSYDTFVVTTPGVQTVSVGWYTGLSGQTGSLIGMGPTKLEVYRIA